MSVFPYFNHFPADFALEVQGLSCEATGAHMLLKGLAWRSRPPCSVPDDDTYLATLFAEGVWTRVSGQVRRRWVAREGYLFCEPLERQWEKARNTSTSRAEAGRKGGKAHKVKPPPEASAKQPEAFAKPGQAISESESDHTKTGRGGAGARPVPIAAIEPDRVNADSVWNALEAWAGRELSAAHGERHPVSNAIRSWEQDPPMPDGTVWHEAVIRCCKAAQRGGTQFGTTPKYAITVINRLLAAWREGKAPEPEAGAVIGPRFVPDDDAHIQAGLADSRRRRAAKAAGGKA